MMSILRSLDATHIAARQSAALVDPAAWAMSIPVATRPPLETSGPYSWRTLPRNPRAVVVTAMVATMMAGDALVRVRDAVATR